MPRKAPSRGLGRPWRRSPCGLPWVSGVVPPTGTDVEDDWSLLEALARSAIKGRHSVAPSPPFWTGLDEIYKDHEDLD